MTKIFKIKELLEMGYKLPKVEDENLREKEYLTPKPIAVEVEIEDWRGDGEDPEIGNHRKDLIFPKTKDNIVVIKKYIYGKD